MDYRRKKVYISVTVNFLVGIILGIVLFYGQIKSQGKPFDKIYEYDKTVVLSDFLRLSWLNVTWMLSIFFAHSILPLGIIHPIMVIRGSTTSFSVLYILALFGWKEALLSALPQCFSILPLLAEFSVETVLRCSERKERGQEICMMKRYEIASLLVFSVIAGAAEVLLFRFFCRYLF